MELKQRVDQVYERIAAAAKAAGRKAEEITLCAATKVQSDQTIRDAISAGITVCGENRVQELTGHLQADAYAGAKEVHFIGHLQTNKVKQVVGLVDLIHSVDSERLLRAIDAQAEKVGTVQDILLEVNIGREESKGGCMPEQVPQLCQLACELEHVSLRGLMAILPFQRFPEQTAPILHRCVSFLLTYRRKCRIIKIRSCVCRWA